MMNIQAINGIVSSANSVYGAVKNFVSWGGHKIQLGFSNYMVPTIKSLWSSAAASFKNIFNFLKTGPGVAIAAAAGLFVFGIAALRISSQKDYDEQENKISQTVWKAIGATSIAAATATAGIGIALIAL